MSDVRLARVLHHGGARDDVRSFVARMFGVRPAGAGCRWALGEVVFETLPSHVPSRRSGGWQQLSWTVSDVAGAARAVAGAGLAVHLEEEADLAVVDGGEIAGLRIELTTILPAPPGSIPQHDIGHHPLQLSGSPTLCVATPDPDTAATVLAELAGTTAYHEHHVWTNARVSGVALTGHRIEFLGSRTGSAADLIGRFLAEHGPGPFAVSLLSRDLDRARAFLADSSIRFSQYGSGSLIVDPHTAGGPRFEIRAA